jgi:hypothetical protein
MYTQKNGAIPKGMVIRHKCDNRKCINPDHFEIGTQRQNMQDMVERGRSLTGEKHPLVKLTEAQVIEIWERALKGECHLAKEYGVSYSTISKIRKGERWKHI